MPDRRRVALLVLGLAVFGGACSGYPGEPQYRLNVEPESLAFVARQGGQSPPARFFTVSSEGVIAWSAFADVPWLSLEPGGGGVPQSVLVTPDNRGLVLGTYRGHVTFTAAHTSNSPASVVVRLDIVAQAPLAGRWVALESAPVLSLDLRDSSTVVAGTGLLVVGSIPFTVAGVRTADTVAMTLMPDSGTGYRLTSYFAGDNVMRGLLVGPGYPGDSVVIFRQ